jgi:hypothetical protein
MVGIPVPALKPLFTRLEISDISISICCPQPLGSESVPVLAPERRYKLVVKTVDIK